MAGSDAIQREYRERGFVILRGFLRRDEASHIRHEVQRYIRDIAPDLPWSDTIRERGRTTTLLRNVPAP